MNLNLCEYVYKSQGHYLLICQSGISSVDNSLSPVMQHQQQLGMIALICVIALFLGSAQGMDCTGHLDGVYPNPKNCSTFYKCSNFIAYLYVCPDNLLFDEWSLRCEWPELARCPGGDCFKHSPGELHGAIGCHGHKYGDSYPDPYDCESFYHCTAGTVKGAFEAHIKQCPAGLHFNEKLQDCSSPETAACKFCGPDPTEPPTTITHAPTDPPTTTSSEASTTGNPTKPTTTRRTTTWKSTKPTTTRRTTTRRPPGDGSSSEEDSSSSSSSSEEN